MSSNLKTEISTSDFEADTTRSMSLNGKARVFRILDGTRIGLTMLALCVGIVVLGVSASAVDTYRDTHLPQEFMLPLWPEDFNLRPTVAMVACGSIVIAVNAIALLVSKVSQLRGSALVTSATNVLAPLLGLIVSLVAMVYYYAVNASNEVDTVQSWSCRWRNVVMMTEPHFGTLCRQHEAGVALSVVLVPLELALVLIAGYQILLAKSLSGEVGRTRRVKNGSPTPS